MALYRLGQDRPEIANNRRIWIAPGAHVIGRVTLGLDVSVWFGAVIRGDTEQIDIGEACNIQDGSVLHADPGFPLVLGSHVTIGHGAIVHGCRIGENSLVGMGATVLNGAVIGRNCLIGAGALVTEGKTFPDNSLIVGSPAKAKRILDDAEAVRLRATAEHYVRNGQRFLTDMEELPEGE